MEEHHISRPRKLRLRVGDWVEVRSAEEILETLDDRGCLDALPFMPEMLQYCGKRFRVYKSAHKTCDIIHNSGNRRMKNAVHLVDAEGIRCDGTAHDGCQAECLLFWKDAWLKGASGPNSQEDSSQSLPERVSTASPASFRDGLVTLAHSKLVASEEGETGEKRYRCQATEMFRATEWMRWWDPRPYIKDLISRNIRVRDFILYTILAAFNSLMLRLGARRFPHVHGIAVETPPDQILNLQPGEFVQVRSKDEIMRTLNVYHKHRGLWFDWEMVPFCGKTFRVRSRVVKLVEEKNGLMTYPKSACLILEGAACGGCLSIKPLRLFCPRSVFPYWHEVWLKRVNEAEKF